MQKGYFDLLGALTESLVVKFLRTIIFTVNFLFILEVLCYIQKHNKQLDTKFILSLL